MNAPTLRLLLALAAAPSPDPQPESLEPRPPWKDDPPEPPPLTPDGWDRAAYADAFPAPQIDHVRGRVSVARGPNRKQRRAR